MSPFHPDHTVFHVTTADRADACLKEGIMPRKTSEASEKSFAMDDAYDAARPSDILNTGISRATAVYAHPEREFALERANGGWLSRTQKQLVTLAIFVPTLDQAFVCDGLLNVEPYTAEEYWASFVTLGEYRSQVTPTFTTPDQQLKRYPKRFVYIWPEVLLRGPVPPDAIELLR